uniref:Uncharacterized protein n=1 Tax=Arion vulgaris TaxID=1028688 RepID=A0A0B7BYD8_9EUPU
MSTNGDCNILIVCISSAKRRMGRPSRKLIQVVIDYFNMLSVEIGHLDYI